MAEYNHREIEPKWQSYWTEKDLYKVENTSDKPKYYVLDMFPYPSGAGLHVGHPLGYIASDIVTRFKKLKGFNVLHPMGFDAFGLPAEQYAIDTGQHPAITTDINIKTFKEQLAKIGFSFDWSREVRTSSPDFYKWTQWIFMQLFNAWYSNEENKAKHIDELIKIFERHGNTSVNASCDDDVPLFTADQWNAYSEEEKLEMLLNYRLTFVSEALVNWCPKLGTVLANDEVKDGFSERGGYPVERKKMRQWMMRITAFADRLLQNLDKLDWSDSLKEMQRNWIGKSHGCELDFKVDGTDITLTAFTTRPDTIYGVTYVVVAPEHELVAELTTPDQKSAVEEYVSSAKNRSERERMADVKTVSGVFTGSYVVNPINEEKVQLWIADYVLAGYGTGVVMAVPSSDDRDFRFANHFGLPIRLVIEGTEELDDPTEIKDGKLINSDFLNGLMGEKIYGEGTGEASWAAIKKAEELGVGKKKVNFRMRDAVFSRQRYWGEPVPVYFKNELPYLVEKSELPLELPAINEYKPTETGEPPLGRATDWKYQGEYPYELTTMPGWAGSSWYFLRYMDAQNDQEFVSKEATEYWNSVDLYIGGTEHATGHLLYSRFWNLFLYDMGFIAHEEPFQKLVNQGMIQGRSNFVYKVKDENKFVSAGLKKNYETSALHVDVSFVQSDVLDIEAFKKWRPEYADATFELEGGKYICGHVVEKMSKSKYNVVNPDTIIEKYGADTLRMYEMFLGPLEDSKPWNTDGIEGVSKFLKKFWRLFENKKGEFEVSDAKATKEELKVLHKTIKKIGEDIERLSFNTSVSAFMVCANELGSLKCNKKEILEPLLVVLSPFAPHITEELWSQLGHTESITLALFPAFDESYLKEDAHEYPISINGKVRTKLSFGLDMSKEAIEKEVMANEVVQKWLDGKQPKKVIVVPKRIVNVVI
ncbi:leucine--tRNA ligase [Flammeovirgaceae bacterium SG7u.111]|nr:leucine--tRNA ligase [Flammeovirgaceae bacterium SG7u.132]WPO35528.1 leucine--tRNA ligase [Flammeovirgaceae bacterium SG7u.111]